MGLLDSLNTDKLKSTLQAASKLADEAEKVVRNVADATSELLAEQQEKRTIRQAEKEEIERQKKETKELNKRFEAAVAAGYYEVDGRVMVTSANGMRLWLQELGKDTTPALMQVLQTQMQIIKYVESPSMTGMVFDNIILCLSKAQRLTDDPQQLDNIRESFALMIQNYFFMVEMNLLCAEKRDKEEASRLLIQSGEMLSDAVKQVATTLTANHSTTYNVSVSNIFEKEEAQSNYIKGIFSWLANKSLLKEKQENFYKTLEMLFETLDTHADLLGASIITHGMLRRYRHVLVDHYKQVKLQQYTDRGFKIDNNKINQLTSNLISAASSLVNPLGNKKDAVIGTVTSIGAIGGLIADFVNNSKKGLDIEAYCTLQDALDHELENLQREYEQCEVELTTLKNQYKELGIFKLSEKKELTEKTDRKKSEYETIYSNIQIIKAQATQMRQTFPDSFAIRSEIYAYNNNLKRIEQKFVV